MNNAPAPRAQIGRYRGRYPMGTPTPISDREFGWTMVIFVVFLCAGTLGAISFVDNHSHPAPVHVKASGGS